MLCQHLIFNIWTEKKTLHHILLIKINNAAGSENSKQNYSKAQSHRKTVLFGKGLHINLLSFIAELLHRQCPCPMTKYCLVLQLWQKLCYAVYCLPCSRLEMTCNSMMAYIISTNGKVQTCIRDSRSSFLELAVKLLPTHHTLALPIEVFILL